METCWFCNTNLATHQFKVFLHKVIGRTSTTWEKKITSSNMTVPIPRCNLCGAVHQFRNNLKTIYLIVFLLNIPLMALIFGVFNEQTQAIVKSMGKLLSFFVIFIVGLLPTIIVLIVGVTQRKKVELKKWPQIADIKKIKSYSEFELQNHQQVNMYIKLGYSISNDRLKKNKINQNQ